MSNVAAFDKFPDHLLNAASPSTRAVAQLAVRKWAGKFFASTDNAPWYALDPNTLETKGIETMNGALNGRDPLAHTRLDRRRQRLVAAAATFDAFNDKTTTNFWEFDADGRELSRYEDTDQSYVVHDFAITEEHYVLPVSPIKFDLDNIPDFALGKAPATDLFAFDAARHGELKLLPRFGGEAVRVDLGAFGCIFHLGPCWIDEAGRLVAHVLLFEKYDGLGTAMGFDVRTGSGVRRRRESRRRRGRDLDHPWRARWGRRYASVRPDPVEPRKRRPDAATDRGRRGDRRGTGGDEALRHQIRHAHVPSGPRRAPEQGPLRHSRRAA